jgi:hypothetical protein
MARRNFEKRIRCFETLEERRCMAVASAGWDGPGRGTADLTYYIANTPTGLSKADVSAAIDTALDAWSKVAGVQFTESKTPGQARQLDISFAKIDGAGGTLAQAYFPADVNPSQIAGDIQFDSSENWEIGNAKGSSAFDLVRVAVHEIGHALGLEHSHQNAAILAPSVSPNEYFTTLDQDDVDAVLSMYAPASGQSVPAVPTSELKTSTNPPISNPPISRIPAPTPNQPTPPSSKPLDWSNDWSILENRIYRFRWTAGFGELLRFSSRWRLFG